MRWVVKIGGQATDHRALRRSLVSQVAQIARAGHDVAVVHGGGKLLTKTLARLGFPAKFHDGLRITDRPTRDIALMVLAGLVNKQWVAEFEAQGQRALGLCGGDAGLVAARKLLVRENGLKKDLGFVGRPAKVSTAVLEMAFHRGLVPVIASVAPGPQGEYFNINADDFAAAIAVALEADRLVYFTQSGGVWDGEHRLLPVVQASEIRRLIQKGIVRDGMIPKLRSCARTLNHGVGEIDILPPTAAKAFERLMGAGAQVGTRIVKTA